MGKIIFPVLIVGMCGFLNGYIKGNTKDSKIVGGPTVTEVLKGRVCLGDMKFESGDISGHRIYFTKGVSEEQCKSACGLQKAKSWAYSEARDCYCGDEPSLAKTNSEFKSGDCETSIEKIASNK